MVKNYQIQVFKHDMFGEIRVTGTSEEPLFCLVDLCKVLDIKNPSHAKAKLKSTGLTFMKVRKNITNRYGRTTAYFDHLTFVNEQNLYRLIMRSNKPVAEGFQDWVCGEVLPAIRKCGEYVMPKDSLIAKMNRRISELESDVDIMLPKALYADQVLESISCYTTTQIAKELGMTAQELNRLLCELHVQYYQSGQYLLYADLAHRDLAKSRTHFDYNLASGKVSTRTYLVWTEKGRKFIHKKMMK